MSLPTLSLPGLCRGFRRHVQILRLWLALVCLFVAGTLPAVAVYGKAASQFLARSALAGKLEGRPIMVANVPQVSAYLAGGEVDAGFINLTDALGVRERIGGFLEIDPRLHDEIRIVAGVVEGREALPGIKALAGFLAGPEARAILARHGL